MTSFPTFTDADFDVFLVPGLEARMERLIELVRPKLTEIGQTLAPFLSAHCGQDMYAHVAKHARRTVNPPADTWVAFAPNKRGYKAYPHFQIGLWSTHLFIQFAIIYESTGKETFANNLAKRLSAIRKQVPESFYWSIDHTKPEVTPNPAMTKQSFSTLIDRLKHTKNGEALCGLQIERGNPILTDGDALRSTIETTFEQLLPLYRLT